MTYKKRIGFSSCVRKLDTFYCFEELKLMLALFYGAGIFFYLIAWVVQYL